MQMADSMGAHRTPKPPPRTADAPLSPALALGSCRLGPGRAMPARAHGGGEVGRRSKDHWSIGDRGGREKRTWSLSASKAAHACLPNLIPLAQKACLGINHLLPTGDPTAHQQASLWLRSNPASRFFPSFFPEKVRVWISDKVIIPLDPGSTL